MKKLTPLAWSAIGVPALGALMLVPLAGNTGAQDVFRPALMRPAAEAASNVRPVAIFGTDKRRELPANYAALNGKIGLLYEPVTRTYCTAFCVAPDIIATASHCLFQSNNNQYPEVSSLTFKLSGGKMPVSTRIAGSRTGAAKNFVAAGTTVFNPMPPLSTTTDWALAKLEQPICNAGVLEVAAKPVQDLIKAAEEQRIFQVAYHWDFKHWKLAYSGTCAVNRTFNNLDWTTIQPDFADSDELVLHDCATGGASSGSPILMETPNGPVAVAINVGVYTRVRLAMREGKALRRAKTDVIANTAVNGAVFAPVIAELGAADILADPRDISWMQVELQNRGYYSERIDAIMGQGLRMAIRTFEIASGLPPTGLPSRKLLNLLTEGRERPVIAISTVPAARTLKFKAPAKPLEIKRPEANRPTFGPLAQ